MTTQKTMITEYAWDPSYTVSNLDVVMTPALVVYPEYIASNIERTLALLGGDGDRWRVHIKTAKLGYTLLMLVERGVRNFKCATTLELLVACQCGAADVLVAYPVIGANARRVREIAEQFPQVRISVLVENPEQLQQWRGSRLGVFIDINPGMNRTGIDEGHGAEVFDLAKAIGASGLEFRGVHYYDGQHREPDVRERTVAAHHGYTRLIEIVERDRAHWNSRAGSNYSGNADAAQFTFFRGLSQCRVCSPGIARNGCLLRCVEPGAASGRVRVSAGGAGFDARGEPSPRGHCHLRWRAQIRLGRLRRAHLRCDGTFRANAAFTKRGAFASAGPGGSCWPCGRRSALSLAAARLYDGQQLQ